MQGQAQLRQGSRLTPSRAGATRRARGTFSDCGRSRDNGYTCKAPASRPWPAACTCAAPSRRPPLWAGADTAVACAPLACSCHTGTLAPAQGEPHTPAPGSSDADAPPSRSACMRISLLHPTPSPHTSCITITVLPY